MVVNIVLPSMYRRAGRSFLLGFCTFVLGVLLELMFQKFSVTGFAALIDNVLIGIAAGLVVFAYEQQRYRDLTRKLAMMASMNHHVRNALQAILYSPYTLEQAEQVKVIQDSVNRIQWALNEVLAGDGDVDQTREHKAA
jgi:glycopeptide antibiotics resistance protein